MMAGYIKLHRKFLKWGWYDDPITKAVFLHLLLNANWDDGEYHGVPIKAGQVVFGRKKYAKDLGLSEQNIRTAMKHLHESGEISTTKSTNRFTIVTIEKWDKYQCADVESNQQSNQQVTNNQPTTNQQLTTSKNIRNKEIKNNSVQETEKEFDLLWNMYPKKSGRKDALRHYKAAKKQGVTFAEVRDGIIAYKNYIEKTGTEKQFIKMGSTFFCQRSWEDDYDVPARKPKSSVPPQPEPPKYRDFKPEPKRETVEMPDEIRKKLREIF